MENNLSIGNIIQNHLYNLGMNNYFQFTFFFWFCRDINGVATLGSLKAKVLKGTVKPSDAVDKAAYHTFKKVTLDTSLEKLDRILDKEHFALVVHSQRLCKYKKREHLASYW